MPNPGGSAKAKYAPLPTTQCGVNIGDVNMHLGIIGMDAYEAAGVSLPETVEEFSQRSGPQSDVGEGQVFDYDEYGNYCTQFTRDGGTSTTPSASAKPAPPRLPSPAPRALSKTTTPGSGYP